MPSKLQSYTQMAEQVAAGLTGSYLRWTAFLTTAARLYKYPFPEQMMIFAQRPDATACAEYDLWNNTMGRYVRRGSKGIALLDDSGDRPRLKYVFDVSDTGGRENARQLYLWQYRPEHEAPVIEALEKAYDIPAEYGLADQLEKVAARLADEYWTENQRDILRIVDDSFLEEYDDFNIGVAFRSAATVSITYALMSRCGLEPEAYFEHEDFLNIFDFNTPATVTALGTAVSQSSQQVLRQIGATIKHYEYERSQANERTELHPERGVSDSRTDLGGTAPAEALGQVRLDAENLSEGTSDGALQQPSSDREADSAPAGDRRGSEQPSGADDPRAGESGRRNGEPESQRPDALGGFDEHLQGPGGGDYPDGAYQQLTLNLFLPEQEQIQIIQQAESVKQAPSALSFSQADIDAELRNGSGTEGGKLRIYAFYQHQPDAKSAAAFLKEEYGWFGHSHTFLDGDRGFAEYSPKGMKLQHYDPHYEKNYTWNAVEKRLRTLISEGSYLTDAEKAEYTDLERDYAGVGGVPVPHPRAGFPRPEIPAVEEPSKAVWDYNAIKEAHPDDIVLYQMGDFYEIYGEDAKSASEKLELHLTTRPIPGSGRVPMCGIPAHQLEQYVEQLRDEYDVTISAIDADNGQRKVHSVLSIDHEAERAINAHEAEYGADGWRAFPGNKPTPTVRELYDQYKPMVSAAVVADEAYRNACRNSDRENAYLEGAAAVKRAVLASGDMQLLRLYSDMTELHNRLNREVLDETYPRLQSQPRSMSQEDIDDALREWNGNPESKRAVVRYMEQHGREKDAAAWLSKEYGGDPSKPLHFTLADTDTDVVMPWPKVQRRIAQLIKEDRFFTEEERDRFDDIDPIAIREALEQRGIVDGQVVDPEKLDQDPFIRQVTADADRISQEEQAQAPDLSGQLITRQGDTITIGDGDA